MQKVEEDKTIPGEPQAQTTTLSIRTSEGGKGKRFLRIWLPLFVHFALALVVAVLVATKLNGYKALAYDWQSRFQPGNNYVLRVSDITTLLSAATTVINFFGGMWTGLIAWRCVFLLLQNDGLTVNRISSILGGTPSLRWPRGLEWAVVIILFFVFPQDYIEPLFSGSVNWNFAIQYGLPYQVGGGSPTASSSLWYWYLTQRVTRLMSTRQAEGLASISWTSTDVQTAVNGTGGIYGGISCRSVISDTVPVNSTIENAVVPCIQIHSITWPNETVPADIEYYTSTSNGNLSIIGDTPFFDYEHGGVTVIFDRERPVWDTYYNIYNQPAFSISAQYAPFPNATIYHGSMAVVVFLLRQEANGCNPVAGQSFGNTNPFGPTGYINEHFGINPFPGFANTQENCFVYGTVNFTAGVVRAPSSTFVSPRVVEYYPPGVDVANEESVVSAINQASNTIEPSIWTREALWLMPDVMTSSR
ncbi:hypothetical protein DPV78_010277 [Talaromyces pinophilus]|nr:hypothetical protein DPV78_010277 [Talaromyces pinophilus]